MRESGYRFAIRGQKFMRLDTALNKSAHTNELDESAYATPIACNVRNNSDKGKI